MDDRIYSGLHTFPEQVRASKRKTMVNVRIIVDFRINEHFTADEETSPLRGGDLGNH